MGKRLVVVMVSLFVVLAMLVACQQDEAESAEWAAEQFLIDLSEGKNEEAYEKMDATMKEAVSVEDLAEIWSVLEQTAGDHVSFEYDKKQEDDGYEIIYIDTTFSKDDVTFMVTVNEDLEIAGFYVI